ncbi:hypothetical protein [Peribacillus tepidiphilus]|uniref:hypothetical protein n=1 Tax=Peribacillus tepidiphilus TaxID=2652445 RepID=UPI0035B4FB51
MTRNRKSVVSGKISVVIPIYRSSAVKYRSSIRYIGRQRKNIGLQSDISVISGRK